MCRSARASRDGSPPQAIPWSCPTSPSTPSGTPSRAPIPNSGSGSIACIPIRSGNKTLGVIQLLNSKLDWMSEYSISFLRILCDYAAIAIQNARSVKLIHELTITDDCTGLFNARHLYTLLDEQIDLAAGPIAAPVQPALRRPRPLQGGQRHPRPPGRKPSAGRGRRPHAAHPRAGKLLLPLRRRRVCRPATRPGKAGRHRSHHQAMGCTSKALASSPARVSS